MKDWKEKLAWLMPEYKKESLQNYFADLGFEVVRKITGQASRTYTIAKRDTTGNWEELDAQLIQEISDQISEDFPGAVINFEPEFRMPDRIPKNVLWVRVPLQRATKMTAEKMADYLTSQGIRGFEMRNNPYRTGTLDIIFR